MASTDIRPFTIDVSQSDLDDLRARLERTRWAVEQPHSSVPSSGVPAGAEYGFPVSRLRALVEYWLDRYQWREHEAALNAYPQFITEIDAQRIHFLHVKSAERDAMPLVLTHGWPDPPLRRA